MIRAALLALVVACTGTPEDPPIDVPHGELSGTVVTSAGAAVGARVRLAGSVIAVRTNDAGRFVVPIGAGGSFPLEITTGDPPAFATKVDDAFLPTLQDGTIGSVDLGTIALEPTGGAHGQITGATTTPLHVVLGGRAEAVAQDGAWSVKGLVPGEYPLAVRAREGTFRLPPIVITAGQDTTQDLALSGATLLRAGAVATTTRVIAQAIPPVSLEISGTVARGTSRADGNVLVEGVPGGVFTLVARGEGLGPVSLPRTLVDGATILPPILLFAASRGCALGGLPIGTAEDEDADGTPDADEPAACRCLEGALDADADGVCDAVDRDVDDDRADDAFDVCPGFTDPDQADADHDHHGDACETDDDDDHIDDDEDNCPKVPNDQADFDHDGTGDACDPDVDGDGAPNEADTCALFVNLDQTDGDRDGLGDACDDDDDDDGRLDAADNCRTLANPYQDDWDHDGAGDTCDGDDDGDGAPDGSDNCAELVNPGQDDADGDAIGDPCDPDLDGDGLENEDDNCPGVPNSGQDDADRDGVGDACEPA